MRSNGKCGMRVNLSMFLFSLFWVHTAIAGDLLEGVPVNTKQLTFGEWGIYTVRGIGEKVTIDKSIQVPADLQKNVGKEVVCIESQPGAMADQSSIQFVVVEPGIVLKAGVEYTLSAWVKHDLGVGGNLRLMASIPAIKSEATTGKKDWHALSSGPVTVKQDTPLFFIGLVFGGRGKAWIGKVSLTEKGDTTEKKSPEGEYDALGRKKIPLDQKSIPVQGDMTAFINKNTGKARGHVNWYTFRWPIIKFMLTNRNNIHSMPFEIFYEDPFKYKIETWNQVIYDGGKVFGFRIPWGNYYKCPLRKGHGYWLHLQSHTLENEHPSYIIVNGKKIWDDKNMTIVYQRAGNNGYRYINCFFTMDEDKLATIDIVVDKNHSPKAHRMNIRMGHLRDIGPYAIIDKDQPTEPIESPADRLNRWKSGVFLSGGGGGTGQMFGGGMSRADLKKKWALYKKPSYPVDDFITAPDIHNNTHKEFADFMVRYCGSAAVNSRANFKKLIAEFNDRIKFIGEHKKTDVINRTLKAYPDKKVYFFDEVWGRGGARDLNGFKDGLADASRFIAVYEVLPAGIASVYNWYTSGVDLVIQKNQEGPQYNLMTANVRGTGKVVGKPYGHYWEGTQYPAVSLQLKEQTMLLWYMAGVDYISIEAEAGNFTYMDLVPEELLVWLRSIKAMRLHPTRGKQQVNIAIMRGPNDWIHGPYNKFTLMDFPPVSFIYDHQTKIMTSKRAANETSRDYDLLDCFFPKFGNSEFIRRDRFLTGTPYGPVDFSHTAISEKDLADYRLLVFLGDGQVDKPLEEKLKGFIEAGGNVVLNVANLPGSKNLFGLAVGASKDFADYLEGDETLFGEDRYVGRFKGKIYELKGEADKVLFSYADKTPVVARKTIGKGAVYLVLTDRAQHAGDMERALLSKLAQEVNMVKFDPGHDQIEYVVQKKGATAIVGIFNHGAIPVGSDGIVKIRARLDDPMVSHIRGPWGGRITVDIKNLGLPPDKEYEIQEVHGLCGEDLKEVVEKSREFWTSPIKSKQANGKITFQFLMNERAEIIIGPKGKAKEQFFK